jgi:alanyl-tRNA synthetase
MRLGEELAAELLAERFTGYLRLLSDPSADEEEVSSLEEVTAWARTVSAGEAFVLHDTYGIPIDVTADVAADRKSVGRERVS